MKHILFILLCTATKCTTAQISNNQISLSNYERLSQNQTDRMNDLLQLKKEQLDSIKSINLDYYYQIAFLQRFKLTAEDRNNKLSEIENSRKYRLEKNLDNSDYKKYYDTENLIKIKWNHRQDSLLAQRRK